MKDYIKMMLEAERLKFLVFAHHLTMLQACTEAVIEAKVECNMMLFHCRIRSLERCSSSEQFMLGVGKLFHWWDRNWF